MFRGYTLNQNVFVAISPKITVLLSWRFYKILTSSKTTVPISLKFCLNKKFKEPNTCVKQQLKMYYGLGIVGKKQIDPFRYTLYTSKYDLRWVWPERCKFRPHFHFCPEMTFMVNFRFLNDKYQTDIFLWRLAFIGFLMGEWDNVYNVFAIYFVYIFCLVVNKPKPIGHHHIIILKNKKGKSLALE